jgi:photosystem II stability/assembly factor-like uncharacterized protein
MKKYSLLLAFLGISLYACQTIPEEQETQSGAGLAMDAWALARAYPDGKIYSRNLTLAHEQMQAELQFREDTPEWESLGPKNIGGRTLCLAFHPTDTGTIWAGSASGGLWKTTTAGVGTQAWERIPLGFPALSISAITIDPEHPDTMYVGTGEVYNYTAAQPGVVNRTTRGNYGIGLLRTTNGGLSWEKSIDWSLTEMRGIWKIAIHPGNNKIIYVATTEGLLKSTDGGDNWENIHPIPMAMDLEISPLDPNIIFVSHGSYLSPERGVYRSLDGGENFSLVPGLPDDYDGKTMISISPSNPNIIYASVANAFSSRGLYRSSSNGNSFTIYNGENIASYQGWYSHDVAIKPDNQSTIIYVGIDTYKSTNGGINFTKKTWWNIWEFGQVPVGGPEGPPNYVHADTHAAYYHPLDYNTIYLATDGGIFASTDNGETWEGRNGGYQTTQFYANFSNSSTDANLAIGGMQDNASAMYIGDDAWVRILGGDGMCTGINSLDDNFIYGSLQNLNTRRSTDRGQTFSGMNIGTAGGEQKAFNAPFELSESNPMIMYAGATSLHKSEDRGATWDWATPAQVDEGNPILTIAISPKDENHLYFSVAPLEHGPAKLLHTTDGGSTYEFITSLPDRMVMDIAFDTVDDAIAYVVLGGFGTEHVFKTTDNGQTWTAIDNGLPDLPTSTIVVDPENPEVIYIGNDIGVYRSMDGGENWESFNTGVVDAAMVMHLSISPSNRKLRIATHGSGVWQADLETPVGTNNELKPVYLATIYPNPVHTAATIEYELKETANVNLRLFDATGKLVQILRKDQIVIGRQSVELDVSTLQSGAYYYTLDGQCLSSGRQFKESKAFVKQ